MINALWKKSQEKDRVAFLREAQTLWRQKYKGNNEEILKLLREAQRPKFRLKIKIRVPKKKEGASSTSVCSQSEQLTSTSGVELDSEKCEEVNIPVPHVECRLVSKDVEPEHCCSDPAPSTCVESDSVTESH